MLNYEKTTIVLIVIIICFWTVKSGQYSENCKKKI
ncbi:cbb3-type cytochrome oxidase assembly protein CcoS [Elizabethkingia miricola]|nr:cbb3-type cytochrome oxidase assembly protein CcoS [Elizabethkingia meningoseptica]NHQ66947.1 cbb3-type cytochrome oxidase assembly protein CcoS [Elizabethkingia miricola]NHQ70186.1 cbb3-type cytochrome oxidase assembly protein CcoS [Elizabethkingia miricola]NHQ77036.1 cbb3-type cytochrome oxidase assembly protein CcoS [Elizabethkingia miricola]